MQAAPRQVILRYLFAVAVVVVVTLLKQYLIAPLVSGQQWFLLFVAAICLSSWYGGFGPGIVTAILSALTADLFFSVSGGRTSANTLGSAFQLMLFLLEGLLVVGLTGNLRDTRQEAQKNQQDKEQALALLDMLQVYAPVGLAFLDNDLRYVRINYAMAELDGLTPAAHIGRRLPEVQPQMPPEMFAAIESVVQTGQPLLDQEVTLTRPTLMGSKRQSMVTSYYRIRGPEGSPLGLGAVMVDITAHKQAEDALRESEARFRAMADTAPVMIWIADENTRALYFNKVWLDFVGKTIDEELGDGWLESVHPDDVERFRQLYLTAFRQRADYQTEYRLRRYDGEYRWILDKGTPRFTPDGTYLGYIGSSTDITERKQLEIGQDFVMNAGVLLAASLDYTTTLNNVARLAVPTTADWCAVDLLTPKGTIERVAVAHVDPEKVTWAYEIQKRFPPSLDAPNGVGYVLRTGETEFVEDVATVIGPIYDSLNDELKQVLDKLQAVSVITTPLKVRGSIIGALTFATAESRRHYTEADVRIAELLAVRAALAVDNSRLLRDAQAERERYRVTLTSVGDAVIATDQQGAVTFLNKIAQNLTGWPESEALGQPLGRIFNIVNEHSRAPVENPVVRVLREGHVVGLANHTVLISKTGAELPIDDSGAPIPEANGAIGGVVLVFRDVSERKRQEQRQEFLSEASQVLIASIDYETTLQNVTGLAVPELADWCIIHLIDEHGVARQVALSVTDPELAAIREEMMRRYPPTLQDKFGHMTVIRSGQSELFEAVSDDLLQSASADSGQLEMMRRLHYKSSICVPLKNRSGVFGSLILRTTQGGRALTKDDLALAEDLAHVAELAIENARLYRRAQSQISDPPEPPPNAPPT